MCLLIPVKPTLANQSIFFESGCLNYFLIAGIVGQEAFGSQYVVGLHPGDVADFRDLVTRIYAGDGRVVGGGGVGSNMRNRHAMSGRVA